MRTGIHLRKLWSDDDAIELAITSSDSQSAFITRAYIGHQGLADLIAGLTSFKDQVYGGIFNIRLGEFGPEFAGGAFRARLHFQSRGKIYVSVRAETDFVEFGVKKVASECTLFFISEPALLDNFVSDLRGMKAGSRTDALLELV